MTAAAALCTKRLYAFDMLHLHRPRPKLVPVARLRALAVRIARDHGVTPPVVVGGRGTRAWGTYYSYSDGNRIELVPWDREKLTLLHEMAHYLQGGRGYDHGPAFVRRYFDLLARYTKHDYHGLVWAAHFHGVRT